ncbi:hypothetical protein LCGC14_0875700 [marine sediment metagenome]|uniref:Uncharacterized protein n=1 Tax=marine sediment metagenome TaxID=412755 RepID=A0A0F9SAF6_9ZZZZ
MRKEEVEKRTPHSTSGEFKESGIIYKCNNYTFEKPFMGLTDYNMGLIENLKNKIKNVIDRSKIGERRVSFCIIIREKAQIKKNSMILI